MGYINELKNRPDHHKKRFALLASSTVTLFIFGIWSMTTFGVRSAVVAENTVETRERVVEVSPLASLRTNLASSFDALFNTFGELKDALKSVDLESGYDQIEHKSQNLYGPK